MNHIELKLRGISLDERFPTIDLKAHHPDSLYASLDERLTKEQGLIPVFSRLSDTVMTSSVATSLKDGIVGYVREYSQETDGIHLFVEMNDNKIAKKFMESIELCGNTVSVRTEGHSTEMLNGTTVIEADSIVAFYMMSDNFMDKVYSGGSDELMHDAGTCLQKDGWHVVSQIMNDDPHQTTTIEIVSKYQIGGLEEEHRIRHKYVGVFCARTKTCKLKEVSTETIVKAPVPVEHIEYKIEVR